MIAIIDYGMGNLRSVQKALEASGAKAAVTQSKDDILQASKVVLPGVGAMKPAMERLTELGLIDVIKRTIEQRKPFLGICLGLQLLMEKSSEGGSTPGLGIFKGDVRQFTGLKVPQIGWNQLKMKGKNCPLFKGIDSGSNVYFCHSYYVNPKDKNDIAAATDYGVEYASSLWRENVFGVQFHPEKSQTIGLKILKNFTELKP
ncbi:MAG TPA: imidazole glycerol phosphate synthase subunit HisH [Candidatus Omnitrophota bacterium]|nr:imidazole glycerol phosphate synthase subunit HisH [Candidatus Omnitrophota bacterium]